MLTKIKYLILLVGLTLSMAQANDAGFVLQNDSVVIDSSKSCVRTSSSSSNNVPSQCAGVTESVIANEEPGSNQEFDGCGNLQCEPIITSISSGSSEIILTEIPFMFDRSDLTTGAIKTLDSFLSAVRQKVSNIISVFGHTDSLGTDEYNDNLSERRASRVKEYLMDAGISGNDISVKGMGEGSPVADNDTRNGRAKNRRVVIEAK